MLNKFDPNAILVQAPGPNSKHVGWIPREIAAVLAGPLDRGALVIDQLRTTGSARGSKIPAMLRMRVGSDDDKECLLVQLERALMSISS
jgi:hypothetical protein